MTRAHYVTHGQTIQRMERLGTLVTELLTRDLPADKLADVLKLSPSGARKYVGDLTAAGIIALAIPVDGAVSVVRRVYTLAVTPEKAQAYLASLATTAPARAARESKSALNIAAREAGRRFHIMQDDAPFSIRVSRAPAMRDPLVAAFFGAGRHEVRA